MALFKNSIAKTVVATLSLAMTDTRTKVGVIKQSVASRITPETPFHSVDVSVSDTFSYTIPSTISTILTVSSAETVIVEITDNTNVTTLTVNGLLHLSGSIVGSVRILGTLPTITRCSLVFS